MTSKNTAHLQRRLRPYFSRSSIERGEDYLNEGLVKAIRSTPKGAAAEVHGSEIYLVSLEWTSATGDRIESHCTCPHFRAGHSCKHLWAFVLALSTEEKKAKISPTKLNWREVFKGPEAKKKSLYAQPEIFVVLQPDESNESSVRLRFFATELNADKTPRLPRPISLPRSGVLHHVDGKLQSILQAIAILSLGEIAGGYEYSSRGLSLSSLRLLLPELLQSGRVFADKDDFTKSYGKAESLALKPLSFGALRIKVTESDQGYLLNAFIDADIPVHELKMIAAPNLFQHQRRVGFLDFSEAEKPWFDELKAGTLLVPHEDDEPFLEAVLNQKLNFDLPPSLMWKRVDVIPAGKLDLRLDKETRFDRYLVDLKFQYGSRTISRWSKVDELPSTEDKKIYRRNHAEEDRVFRQLPAQLLSRQGDNENPSVNSKNMIEFVTAALGTGLTVHVEKRKIEEADNFQVSVSSGLDWFDVDGQVGFSGRWIKYPAILESITRGEKFLPLPDGSLGLINEQINKRLQKLATFASSNFRFSGSQSLLLNSLIESEPNLKLDSKFKALRTKIKGFSGIKPATPPQSFAGKLREYQRVGLGWLNFLDTFGLGGILADDMGLGKTIQCLAFLDGRRRGKKRSQPNLLIAPKSLLENWHSEARKFTPKMRVLVHAGIHREESKLRLSEYDLVVTTYQTMLRDIELFRSMQWDCVIADEAQAIKNSEALISKAIKLLPAQFRLAMTGTPIENSIQNLFSISDFVNPGFLNGKKPSARLKIDEDTRKALSAAFKPVVLRRTKEQVLKDLPPKTEQLIYVDLEPQQLKVYNELKRFYQSQLLKDVREKGIEKSQIQILAALTRLRQAALHPGLIDPNHAKSKSSKFEIVLEMLEELISENHRVLIFSQFTSLLGLLKKELEARKIGFCYLDGQTSKRHEVVREFKGSNCPIFLISLKAGGVGLNLVEADYVFLLDPWWNPAVEAQAIDRIHRIGQKRAVNAYKFIAKNTVEEKILELQKSKLGLAEGILGQKSSPLRSFTAQDIDNLLS